MFTKGIHAKDRGIFLAVVKPTLATIPIGNIGNDVGMEKKGEDYFRQRR